jgi:hypothetical protein
VREQIDDDEENRLVVVSHKGNRLRLVFGVSISDRFPSVSVAEDAIAKSREAIRDIHKKLGKQTTAWVKSNAKQTVSLSQRQKLVKWERGKYGLRNKVRSDCVRLCRRMETVPEDVIIRV